MENVNEFIKNLFQNNIIKSTLVILVSFFIYQFIHTLINKTNKNGTINNT